MCNEETKSKSSFTTSNPLVFSHRVFHYSPRERNSLHQLLWEKIGRRDRRVRRFGNPICFLQSLQLSFLDGGGEIGEWLEGDALFSLQKKKKQLFLVVSIELHVIFFYIFNNLGLSLTKEKVYYKFLPNNRLWTYINDLKCGFITLSSVY